MSGGESMKRIWKNLFASALFVLGTVSALTGCAPADDKGYNMSAAQVQNVSAETSEETVMFGADCFAGERADAFSARGNNNYIKFSPDAGRDYLYRDGQAIAGDSYAFSGTMSMSYCGEDAETEIILKAENGMVRFFLRYNNPSSYSLIAHLQTETQNSYKALSERDSGRMNFLTVWHGGCAYLYIDNTFVTKVETPFVSAHLGFGGTGSRMELERLSVARNEQVIEKLLADLAKPFGRHITGDADYYDAIFFEVGENEYEKRSYHYLQTFYYIDGRPAAGDYYWVEGTVRMENPDPYGQVALMICRDESNKVRFVLERQPGEADFYHIFSDQRIGGAFVNYKSLGSVTETIHFKIVYDEGTSSLYLNDALFASVTCDMGVAHFGIGGNNCQFVVSGLRGGFERE